MPERPGRDPLGAALEWGLAGLVLAAPVPFGAVGPGGRLLIETAAAALLAVWAARAIARPAPLPSAPVRVAALGLVAVAALQLVPLGAGVVAALSPRTAELRADARAPDEVRAIETRLLGTDPAALEPPPRLSVDAPATASALRTGAALAALLFVATTVVAERGARRLAFALLAAASVEGLYGLLVLASGHDHILWVPKRYYLDSATGTFVNKNHFAGFLAMALAVGAALVLDRGERAAGTRRGRLAEDAPKTVLLGLLAALGLAGLLTSFSRAGIAAGLAAIAVVVAVGGRRLGPALRWACAAAVVAAALVPLARVGPERLVARYGDAQIDLVHRGGRLAVWSDTVGLARAFPLLGSGFGTFAAVYPAFRSPEVRLFYDHAHNDALQAVAEGGAVAGVLVLLLAGGLARSAWTAVRARRGPLVVGFAAGLGAIALHGLVDFNFHIPANAAVAAVLAGAVEGYAWRTRA